MSIDISADVHANGTVVANDGVATSTSWILSTTRLRARALCDDDLDFVAEMLGDPVVMTHYPKVLTREESAGWIARQRGRYQKDGHGLWLLVERATGQPVGQCGVAMQLLDDTVEPEVGYLLHPSQWKRGFATEAARAARDWAFARYPRRRVISLIRPANLPSRAVAERNGMTPAGEAMHAGLLHLIYAANADPKLVTTP